MSASRRRYLYTISLISILATLASLLVLSDRVGRLWAEGGALIRAVASMTRRDPQGATWLGFGLAAAAIWAVHWFLANRAARQMTMAGAAERASSIRKAYLYVGQLAALAVCLREVMLLAAAILRRTLGQWPGDLGLWPESALSWAVGALIALAFWGHLRWVTVHDGDFGRETGRAANWRRVYFYTAVLAGSTMIIIGTVGCIRAVVGLAGEAFLAFGGVGSAAIWRSSIVSSVTALITGVPLAIFAWHTSNRLAAKRPQVEFNAPSRVALLYGGILFGTAVTLISLASLIKQTLPILLGQALGTPVSLWQGLITPVAWLPVGLLAWLAFARAARNSALRGGGSPKVTSVRRSCFHLAAAAALGAFWLGLTELLYLILVAQLQAEPGSASAFPSLLGRFSTAAALVMVGAPAWWGHWWPRQARAREAGPAGHEERVSRARKTYLYGIALLAAVVALVSSAMTTYQVISGAGTAATTSGTVAGLFAAIVVAVFWLVAHGMVIRGDSRWLAFDSAAAEREATLYLLEPPVAGPPIHSTSELPGVEPSAAVRSFRREDLTAMAMVSGLQGSVTAQRPVVVIDGGDGKWGAGLLAALRRALPGATLWPIGLSTIAQATMLSALVGETLPPVPPDALALAVVIVGPSDIMISGGLGGAVRPEFVAALAASPARILLLPPRDSRLRWVAAPDWPIERWIENAVVEVGNSVGNG